MAEDFKNKIQRLELENFTCFAKAEMDFSSGINVFIGENGTGKTHVLKVLYACLKQIKNHSENKKTYSFDDNLALFFGLTDDSQLNRNASNNSNELFKIHIEVEEKLSLDINANRNDFTNPLLPFYQVASTIFNNVQDKLNFKFLFLPTQDMLTWHNGFVSLYLDKQLDFDKTYFDLAVALDRPLDRLNGLSSLVQKIENLIGGKVIRKEDKRFYFQNEAGSEYLATLNAQGINKIGQLLYLIYNGSLKKDTVLFWDEPEVNLNPKYIKLVNIILKELANEGVQIFVATHDYLLAHLLSLDAEYSEETAAPPMRFFSFYKGEDGTEIESADNLTFIQNNSILDEYAAYHDLENRLYYQKHNTPV